MTDIRSDERLAGTAKGRSTLLIPELVLAALDERISAMEHAGKGRISRGDVIAALLVAAPSDPTELAALVERYRAMVVGELVRVEHASGEVVHLPQRRRAGRPPG